MLTRRQPNFLNRLSRSVACNRIGAAIFSRILPDVDRLVLWVTGQRVIVSAWLSGLPVVMVTTIGAKSGLQRRVALLYIQDQQNPDTFVLVASNWGRNRYPAWYFNLKTNPQAQCEISGRCANYSAIELHGAEYQHYMALAKEHYAGYALYEKWASHRRIPIMLMQRSNGIS